MGYLHLGPPKHGVCRYGMLLAEEAKTRSDLEVMEERIILGDDYGKNRRMLANAGKRLSAADVVHIQYTRYPDLVWGKGFDHVRNMLVFMMHCRTLVVTTLHDVYLNEYFTPGMVLGFYAKYFKGMLSGIFNGRRRETSLRELYLKARPSLGYLLATKMISFKSSLVLVCSREERKRIKSFVKIRKIRVINHFVEKRDPHTKSDAEKAKKKLGLEGHRVITLLGFLWGSKGHRMVVESIPLLPEDVTVVFAGGPGLKQEETEDIVWMLTLLARRLRVSSRLRITGYLPDDKLEEYIIATDLAVCPFINMASSGSLSTWISYARPILASRLPQMREYNAMEPGSIRFFEPYNSRGFAIAVDRELETCSLKDDARVAGLRSRMIIPVAFDKHLECFKRIIKQNNSKENLRDTDGLRHKTLDRTPA
ncbi:MAG: glycosyltransferase [Candidatus Altiarchaeota archaeon]